MTVRPSKRFAAGAAAVLMFALCGCGGRRLTPVSYEQFADEMHSGGYCSGGSELTTDSEDGTSAIMLTDSGWLAGFYECADSEVAAAEFDYECEQAGIDSYKEGGNYCMADKTSDEGYLLYIRVDNTCLFMHGSADNAEEINAFAAGLGYSDE